MGAATGAITARYHVRFIDTRRPDRGEQTSTVALTADYTTFESIRQILAVKAGVKSHQIDVVSATKVQDNAPRIHRVLDLSTGHLPEDVCDDLNGYEGVTAHKMTHGWLLWVPSDDLDERLEENPDIPAAVVGIWRYAIDRDCAYVLIDADADAVDGLPHWVW